VLNDTNIFKAIYILNKLGVGYTEYQANMKIDLKITLKGYKDYDKALAALYYIITEGIDALTIAGAQAIVNVVALRAAQAEIGGYHYISLAAGGLSQDPQYGIEGEATGQGAEAQFTSEVLPIIRLSEPVMEGGNISRAHIISLKELSTVKIRNNARREKPGDVAKKTAAKAKAASSEGPISGTQYEYHATGDAGSSSGGGTGSEYTDVWQIVEFGTGIFAEHPFWGWGVRTEGRTKFPGPGNVGAWYFGRNLLILGQPGAHFLEEARGGITYALQEFQAAENAINNYLRQALPV